MSLLHDIHDTAMQIRELCNKLDSEISDIGLDVEKKQTKDENIGALMLNTRGRCYPIRNHFMKESEGTQSYILLLVFVFLLLQKYAVRSEEGIQFVERIRRSIGIRESLEALIAAEVSGGNIAVDQWIQDVKEAGAESVFAVDAILLYDQMQAGGKGLEQLVRILSLLGCDEELVNEAAEAAMYIEKGDWISLFRAGQNWEQVNSDLFEGYFTKKELADSQAVKVEKAEIIKLQKYLSKNYYKLAYQCFREAAENDDHRAQLLVGISFHYGLGVKKNSTVARSWLEKVAKSRCKERSAARAELKLLDQEKAARKSGNKKISGK